MMNLRIASTMAAALLAALALLTSSAAAQQAVPSVPKVGFVNTARVLHDSRAAQAMQKSLEAEFRKREQEIDGGPKGEVERRKAALVEDMNQRREFALKQFIDKSNGVIKKIAEAENFEIVFFEAAYFNARVDITDKVIKAIDAGS